MKALVLAVLTLFLARPAIACHLYRTTIPTKIVPKEINKDENQTMMKIVLPTVGLMLLLSFLGNGGEANIVTEANNRPRINIMKKPTDKSIEIPESSMDGMILVLGAVLAYTAIKK